MGGSEEYHTSLSFRFRTLSLLSGRLQVVSATADGMARYRGSTREPPPVITLYQVGCSQCLFRVCHTHPAAAPGGPGEGLGDASRDIWAGELGENTQGTKLLKEARS
jgi:hypothetical protein